MLAHLWDITTISAAYCAVFLSPDSSTNFQNNTFFMCIFLHSRFQYLKTFHDVPQLLSASMLLTYTYSVDVQKQAIQPFAIHEPITSASSSLDQTCSPEMAFAFATGCVIFMLADALRLQACVINTMSLIQN
ncbi:hypothetical protein EDD18DRAFT_1354455 [Armillaria luteobubalina]|uniref:Uncharacterized protein n=1 Tax=Armillaria luteobubalina TaxID=153913 RepID=A0AA39Q363_9AGAR|nr:hypothetical protein EDD18DRAFT_1354455 [Armillaria luteobubalina]